MNNFLVSTSVLILLVVVVRFCCHRHISMRLQYALWLLVAVKLLIFPVPWIESAVSILPVSGASGIWSDVDAQGTDNDQTWADNPVLKNSVSQSDDNAQGTDSNQALGTNPLSESSASNKEDFGAAVEETEPAKILDHDKTQKILNMIFGGIALLGSGTFAVAWIIYNLNFRRYLIQHRKSLPCEMAFGKKLPVYVLDNLPSPCLCGQAIYVTAECVEDEGKLRHVLAHEYSHERQGDRLWSVVRGLCLVCYWWHPLVWLAVHLSKQDCELACDEAAIRLLGEEERLEYGKTLLGLIQVKSTPKDYLSIATTMTSGKKSLMQRISMIAKKQRIFVSVCVLAVFAAVLGTVSTCTVQKNEDTPADTEQNVMESTETGEAETTEKAQETGSTEEAEAEGAVEESTLTGERLQKLVEGDMWEKSVTVTLYLYDIDTDRKEVTAWAFASHDNYTDALVTYMDEKRDGTIVSQNLRFSEACQYYVCQEVGKTDAVSVGFDDFSQYISERRETVDDYSRDGAVMCRCNMVKGQITRVELLNPYPDITNISNYVPGKTVSETYPEEKEYTLRESLKACLYYEEDNSEVKTQDTIEVYTGPGNSRDYGMVMIYSGTGADAPFCIEADFTHAGARNIYLLHQDGIDYLVELELETRGGWGSCRYYVYKLGNQAGPNAAVYVVDAAEYYFDGEALNEDSFQRWTEKMRYYLEDAKLLLTTESGAARVGEENDYYRNLGVLDDEEKLRKYLLGD